MIVITTEAHAAHDPATMAPSLTGRPFYDRAARVEQLLSAVKRLNLPTVVAPDHGVAPITAVVIASPLGKARSGQGHTQENDRARQDQ